MSEKTRQNFEFDSPTGGSILLWLLGIMPMLWAVEGFPSWGTIRGNPTVFLFLDLPFRAFLWGLGLILVKGVAEIRIRDRTFSFRHFRNWKSVPLESVTNVRQILPAIYVRIDDACKRYRLIFADVRLSFAPPPVLKFLRETCTEHRESR